MTTIEQDLKIPMKKWFVIDYDGYHLCHGNKDLGVKGVTLFDNESPEFLTKLQEICSAHNRTIEQLEKTNDNN